MIERTIVKIYAEALHQIAEERRTVDEVYGELRDLEALFRDSRELSDFLSSPMVDRNEKKRIVTRALGPAFTQLTIHFLLTLVEKNREALIPYMADEFKSILDRVHNRIEVDVTSARPLHDDIVRRLAETLSRSLDKEVILHNKTDPGILGGIVVRVEDWIMDGSLRGQIEKLREQLLGVGKRSAVAHENTA